MNLKKRIIFMVGSGLAMPTPCTRGVPPSSSIAGLIRQRLGPQAENYSCEASSYQAAFEGLRGTEGPDAVNRIVRESVLEARKHPLSPEEKGRYIKNEMGACVTLGRDTSGWDLAPGMVAIGELIARYPGRFERVVLTSNFDPLIEVSLRRAGCAAIPVHCDIDAPLEPVLAQGPGVVVVHFHGSWEARNTLHRQTDLEKPREQLANSLKALISNAAVVVIGYSGWKDLFTNVLGESIKNQTLDLEVIWCNYSKSIEDSLQNQAVQAIIGASCVAVYGGIDANNVLPDFAKQLSKTEPLRRPAAPTLIFDVTRQERPSPCYFENRWGLDRGCRTGVLFLPASKSSSEVRDNLAAVESQVRFEAEKAGLDLPHRDWVVCRLAVLGTIPGSTANLIGAVCELEQGDLRTISLHLRSAESLFRNGCLSLLLTSRFPADTDPLKHIAQIRQAVKTLPDAQYLSYPLPAYSGDVDVSEGAQNIDAWPGARCHELTDDDVQIARFGVDPGTFDESLCSRQLASARSFVTGVTTIGEFVPQANLTQYGMALRLGLADSLSTELLEIAGAESSSDIWWLVSRANPTGAFLATACRLPVHKRAILGLVSAAEWRSLTDFERESITEMRGGDPLNVYEAPVEGAGVSGPPETDL